jgi:hypothetical protein
VAVSKTGAACRQAAFTDGAIQESIAMLMSGLFVLHLVVTCVMAGIMWFVQIVYYPNLAVVGRDAFVFYQREHVRRVTAIAWTMLFLELISGLALACVPHSGWIWGSLIANALLLLGIWWSTFFVQVPLHHRLEQGWDEGAHLRLVRTNWFRTVVYTLRGAVVIAVLWAAIQPV